MKKRDKWKGEKETVKKKWEERSEEQDERPLTFEQLFVGLFFKNYNCLKKTNNHRTINILTHTHTHTRSVFLKLWIADWHRVVEQCLPKQSIFNKMCLCKQVSFSCAKYCNTNNFSSLSLHLPSLSFTHTHTHTHTHSLLHMDLVTWRQYDLWKCQSYAKWRCLSNKVFKAYYWWTRVGTQVTTGLCSIHSSSLKNTGRTLSSSNRRRRHKRWDEKRNDKVRRKEKRRKEPRAEERSEDGRWKRGDKRRGKEWIV